MDLKNALIFFLEWYWPREMHPVSFDKTLVCKSTVVIYTCTNENMFCFFWAFLWDENLEIINTVHLHRRSVFLLFFFKLMAILSQNKVAVQASKNLSNHAESFTYHPLRLCCHMGGEGRREGRRKRIVTNLVGSSGIQVTGREPHFS